MFDALPKMLVFVLPPVLAAVTVLFWWLEVGRVNVARRWYAAGAALVAVDSPDVFAHGHLEQAINIPFVELAQRAGELDRRRPVIVYGRGGMRAARAVYRLRALGFRRVLSLGAGRDPVSPRSERS